MIRPRNTLVLVELLDKPAKTVGAIVVPTNKELYTNAVVLAVGPGTVAAEGGVSETADLKPGQLVLLKHKERDPRQGPGANFPPFITGIEHREGDKLYYLYEQTRIVGIIADEGQYERDNATAKSPIILN